MRNLLFLMSVLLIGFSGCNQQIDAPNSIQGVWQYQEDSQLADVTGMSFFTETHFAFVVNYTDTAMTDDMGVLAYAGTYVLEDSVVKATILNAQNKALIGQQISWIHRSGGQSATYEILGPDNEITGSGKVMRLE